VSHPIPTLSPSPRRGRGAGGEGASSLIRDPVGWDKSAAGGRRPTIRRRQSIWGGGSNCRDTFDETTCPVPCRPASNSSPLAPCGRRDGGEGAVFEMMEELVCLWPRRGLVDTLPIRVPSRSALAPLSRRADRRGGSAVGCLASSRGNHRGFLDETTCPVPPPTRSRPHGPLTWDLGPWTHSCPVPVERGWVIYPLGQLPHLN
jgi:hypothetical protein